MQPREVTPGVYWVGTTGPHHHHRGIAYGVWLPSKEQGDKAGIDLVSLGEIDAPGQLESKARQDKEGGVYRKLVFRDRVLVGAILLGDSTGHQEIARAIAEKRPPVGVSA